MYCHIICNVFKVMWSAILPKLQWAMIYRKRLLEILSYLFSCYHLFLSRSIFKALFLVLEELVIPFRNEWQVLIHLPSHHDVRRHAYQHSNVNICNSDIMHSYIHLFPCHSIRNAVLAILLLIRVRKPESSLKQ